MKLRDNNVQLHEATGQQWYQTKTHEGVIPSNLHECEKSITIRDGSHLYFDTESKRKKLNTPVET